MNVNIEFYSHDIELCQELIAYIENMKFKNFNKKSLLRKVKELLKAIYAAKLARQILESSGTNGCN